MKFLAAVLLLSLPAFADINDMHLIYVNGVAEKTVEPNMLMVRVESWAKSPTAKGAQEEQALQFDRIKAAAEKFKIKKEDLQTEGFWVNPEYVWDQKAQINKVSGYRVSHTVLIIYRKTEDSGALLDALVTSKGETSGINVQNLTWDYDKRAVVESATLADAVKNARSKADELAKAAGVEIRAVHKIQHTSYAPPVAQPMFEMKAAAGRMMSDGVAAPTELQSGQIKVRVDVQMEFEI